MLQKLRCDFGERSVMDSLASLDAIAQPEPPILCDLRRFADTCLLSSVD